jgi:hypothetical protein
MEMTKPDDKKHRVEKWLVENVTILGDVKSIVLSKFTWKPDQYRGHFYAAFDGVEYSDKFSFSLGESDGYTNIQIPMFHSPLGVPASYLSIEIPGNVERAIENEIRTLFPRVTPHGRNKKTKKYTDAYTPTHERLSDPDALLKTVETITDPKFEIRIDVGSLPKK